MTTWHNGLQFDDSGYLLVTATQLGTSFQSALAFGVSPSAVIDQTVAINNASVAAASAGVGLYWPGGTYIYSGNLTTTVPWLGAGSNIVEFRKLTALGKGANLSCSSSNILISGITFNSPNTPSNAIGDAAFGDTCLIFLNCANIIIDGCVFKNSYGTITHFENVKTGRISNNRVYTCYKDGFHITGLSTDIERIGNLVEDGGDDAFPVVGYTGGTSPGQPQGITDIGNTVRGCKTGAGFKYAGVIGVTNVGCKVDGKIPTSYGRSATQMSCQSMFIDVDSGASLTMGSENIMVTGLLAQNCGRGSAPFASVVSAIQVTGGTGQVIKNVCFTNCQVVDSASAAFLANGGVTGGIDGLHLKNFVVDDTSDPNGYVGTAGTAKFTGISLQRVNNFTFDGVLKDTGAGGIQHDNTNTGEFDIKVKSYNINKAAQTGGVRIIDGVNTTSSLSRLKLDLYIAAHTAATSGNAGFVDRAIFASAPGVIESLRFEQDNAASISNIALLPGSYTNQTVPASAAAWTNSTNAPQIVLVVPGTATALVINRGRTGAYGAANIAPVAASALRTYTLAPNEQLLFTYSAVGTMTLQTCPACGI